MISWASHKQPIVINSSCYAEYVALHNAFTEVVFLHQLLDGLQLLQIDPTPLYCDNDTAHRLIKDQHWHAKVRHFQVKYHFIRELIDLDKLRMIGILSSDNTFDILMKALARPHFEHLHGYLGVGPPHVT